MALFRKPEKKKIWEVAGYSRHKGLQSSLQRYAAEISGDSPEQAEQILTGLGRLGGRQEQSLRGKLKYETNLRASIGESNWQGYQSWIKDRAVAAMMGPSGTTPTSMALGSSILDKERQLRRRRKHYGSTILAGRQPLGVAAAYRQILG